MIASWEEIDRLASLEHLRDVLFIGNPLYAKYHGRGAGLAPANGNGNDLTDGPAAYVREMRKRLKHLKKLDGKVLDVDGTEDIDAVEQVAAVTPCCNSK